MTTLRRVLLQSAKEAGPVEGPSSSHRPSTPHTGKSTPRRPSPHLSASEDESIEDDNNVKQHHSANEKKHHLSKRRRTSRGWEDAGEKESENKSPKITKGHDSAAEVASIKSPRLGSKTNSSSSMVSSSTLSKSPKSSAVSSPTAQVPEKPSNAVTASATLPPPPPPPPPAEEEPVKKEKETTSARGSGGGAAVVEDVGHARNVQTDAQQPSVTTTTSKRLTRTPSPPVVSKDVPKEAPKPERQVSVSSAASAAPVSRQTSGKSSSSGTSSLVTHAVIAQEWVQCEDCKKWRKLPLNIAASSLPESWFCHMNTWNTALASCEASVEEGSEETTEDPSSGTNAGRSEMGTGTGAVGIGAGGGKRNTALPPGINLYGGQVQPPPLTLGPSGAKQPRFSTYRDLIGAHYRNNKQFMNTFNSTCDARYAAFPTYVSNTLKPRTFDHKSTLLAFPKLGWMVSNGGIDSMMGGVKYISAASPPLENTATPSPTAGPSNMDNSSNPLPPKMLFKTFANKS